jgi:hypothetical protein
MRAEQLAAAGPQFVLGRLLRKMTRLDLTPLALCGRLGVLLAGSSER